MNIGVIEVLGRDAKFLSSEAFGPCFWTWLARCISGGSISGVQLSVIQQICYPLSAFDHCYMLFSRCIVWCLCVVWSPFFLWLLGKTTPFLWTRAVQMFRRRAPIFLAVEARPQRQKQSPDELKSGLPRLRSARYLGI